MKWEMLREFGFQVFVRYGIPEGAERRFWAGELSWDEIYAAENEWNELVRAYFATEDQAERERLLRRAKKLLETRLPAGLAPSPVEGRPC